MKGSILNREYLEKIGNRTEVATNVAKQAADLLNSENEIGYAYLYFDIVKCKYHIITNQNEYAQKRNNIEIRILEYNQHFEPKEIIFDENDCPNTTLKAPDINHLINLLIDLIEDYIGQLSKTLHYADFFNAFKEIISDEFIYEYSLKKLNEMKQEKEKYAWVINACENLKKEINQDNTDDIFRTAVRIEHVISELK